MPRRNLDLWLLAAGTASGVAIQALNLSPLFRVIFGLPLVLLCPGYALVAALFPRPTLGWPERVLLSLGLSLVVAILGAIGLNFSPWGLQTAAWTGLFAGVTLVACLVAARRRRANPGSAIITLPRRALHWSRWAGLGLAALLTVGAMTWVQTPQPVSDVVGYTVLWMTPGAEADLPVVRVGLRSSELTSMRYRLTFALDGQLIGEVPEITLAPGDEWERRLELPAEPSTGVLEAVLYRLDAPNAIYRRVTLQR